MRYSRNVAAVAGAVPSFQCQPPSPCTLSVDVKERPFDDPSITAASSSVGPITRSTSISQPDDWLIEHIAEDRNPSSRYALGSGKVSFGGGMTMSQHHDNAVAALVGGAIAKHRDNKNNSESSTAALFERCVTMKTSEGEASKKKKKEKKIEKEHKYHCVSDIFDDV